MIKNNLGNLIKKSIENQDKFDQEKYAKADSIVGNLPKLAKAASTKGESSVERAIFSMPPTDLALVDVLRNKAGAAGRYSTTKSEIVRAALHALSILEQPELIGMLNALQKVRKGN